jgi:hypothetical protein
LAPFGWRLVWDTAPTTGFGANIEAVYTST